MTAREILEARVSDLNAVLVSGVLDGKEAAFNDVKAAAETAKAEALKTALAEMCKLQPAEVVAAYCKNQSYTYPAYGQNDAGRYEVSDKSSTLPYVAIEEAYYAANKVKLTNAGDYNKYVAVLLYCCQRHAIAKSSNAEYSVAHLAGANKEKFDTLAAADKRWKGTTMADLEFQFSETLAAVLPYGYTLAAPIRNSDRRYFAQTVTKPDGKGSFAIPRADTVYKYLFMAMQWAAEKHIYDVKSSFAGFVSGVEVKPKEEKPRQEEAPAQEETASETPAA